MGHYRVVVSKRRDYAQRLRDLHRSIHDRAGSDGYVEKALPTVIQTGGHAIVVDDNPEAIEGQWHGSRVVMLEFDSVEAARNWYKSAQYQAVIGGRHASTEANAAIVSAFEMPGG